MYELKKYETLIQPVSDNDFNSARENLMKNLNQKSFYRENQFVVYENETISSDFASGNLRRSYYKNSQINKANLTNVGFSGSVFISTDFYDCILNNTKLDFCELDNCEFRNTTNYELSYLNLNESIICNSRFINLDLHGANFTNAVFDKVLFKDCNWKSLCLEGTVFKNTFLDHVNLQKLNFEFSYFDNIKMDHVCLPFPTIPYIFNGLQYLMRTSDSVNISSAASDHGYISVDEYLNFMDDLIAFYTKTQNFFPLANIYIAQEKYDHAYAAILSGIRFSMTYIRNFRLVFYYSKLLQITENFTTAQRTEAYNMIMNFSGFKNWRTRDYYNFSLYIDKIRNTLLNEKQGDFICITLDTNIMVHEYDKLLFLYQACENILQLVESEQNKKITHYVEIRHNSPYDIFIKAFADAATLAMIFDFINLALTGAGILLNQKKDKKSEKKENEKLTMLNDIKNDLESEEIDYYKQQNEQLLIQNTLLKKMIDDMNNNISNKNIVINNINYHISNNNI